MPSIECRRWGRVIGFAVVLTMAFAAWPGAYAQEAAQSDDEDVPEIAADMEADVPEPPADIDKGRQIAEQSCSGCHAVGVEGASPLPEAPPFRFLGRNYPVRYLQEALAEGIVTGHPDMPEFAWDPVTINNFISYLETIQVAE